MKATSIEEPGHLSLIEDPDRANLLVDVEGVISSSSKGYLVPREVRALVPLKDGGAEEIEHEIPLDSSDNLKLIGISDEKREKRLAQIATGRTKALVQELSHRIILPVRVRPMVFTLEQRGEKIVDEKGRDYKPYDFFIASDTAVSLPPSTRVILTGTVLPDPRTQRATLLASSVTLPDVVEGFDREKLTKLRERFGGLPVESRITWVLENFEKFSGIIGRRNLIYVGILGFFTPLWVEFDGDLQRGWGIVLIIGDTTTGKSEIVLKLIQLLHGGTLITAETASAVGLTGTATQSESGEWLTDWGFLPLNDQRLLAIDGSQKLSLKEWATLAEAERRGVVIKATAAKGTAYARTR